MEHWVAQGWLTEQETCIALQDMATLTALIAQEAERITRAGAVRIVLSLLADLFAMLFHHYGSTAVEVETPIDRLHRPLLAQIMAYRRRQATG